MGRYLLDDNIPVRIERFNHPDFTSAADLGIVHSDTLMWEYAKEHNLIIVSKDFDFRHRIIKHGPPPKVVHIQCGNLRIRAFRVMVDRHWDVIETLLNNHSLVTVFEDTVMATF